MKIVNLQGSILPPLVSHFSLMSPTVTELLEKAPMGLLKYHPWCAKLPHLVTLVEAQNGKMVWNRQFARFLHSLRSDDYVVAKINCLGYALKRVGTSLGWVVLRRKANQILFSKRYTF